MLAALPFFTCPPGFLFTSVLPLFASVSTETAGPFFFPAQAAAGRGLAFFHRARAFSGDVAVFVVHALLAAFGATRVGSGGKQAAQGKE